MTYSGLALTAALAGFILTSASAAQELIDLAASTRDPDTLYAATENGLFVSTDAGGSFEALIEGAPASLVEVTADGTLYAFVLGRGLLRASEGERSFSPVRSDWGNSFLIHLAVDEANPNRLFGATQQGAIFSSLDGGQSWALFGADVPGCEWAPPCR